ncbi:MAG: energy coupling factor transporter S component ThiW [Alkalibacterium sp.]|nr:energy coupling factor transporter S component ThiW [Alkalibacterium sp.]
MIGAFLSGMLFRHYKKFWLLGAGEVIGTGIFGALIELSDRKTCSVAGSHTFRFPAAFFLSSLAGTIIGLFISCSGKREKFI